MIWTVEGKILGVNQAALDTFGCGIEDMIGSDISEIYVEHSDLTSFHLKLNQEGAVRGYELRLKKRDGTVMDCLLTASVRKGRGWCDIGIPRHRAGRDKTKTQ